MSLQTSVGTRFEKISWNDGLGKAASGKSRILQVKKCFAHDERFREKFRDYINYQGVSLLLK